MSSSRVMMDMIDWHHLPTLVFESDDRGKCGMCADVATRDEVAAHPRVRRVVEERGGRWVALDSTLEDRQSMEALFEALERHRGWPAGRVHGVLRDVQSRP